jgi:hypothetical protein
VDIDSPAAAMQPSGTRLGDVAVVELRGAALILQRVQDAGWLLVAGLMIPIAILAVGIPIALLVRLVAALAQRF